KQTGIHLVDRCPLDPLTFGTKSERKTKARDLLRKITDGESHSIEKGHLIYLEGDIGDIQQRNSYKHKYWTEKEIKDLIQKIDVIYKEIPRTNICTRGRSPVQVSREIAKVIFLEHYGEINLEDELKAHASGKRK